MAYEELCMYCFEDRQGQPICPHCGRDSRAAVPQVQMLPGTLVYHDRFLVGRALGQDATGIVYAAFDTKRENKLRLREYLPRDCAERLNDGSVAPVAGQEDQFDKGMKKLRASVEGVEDPHKRHFYFEENGTAYIAQRKSAAAAGRARNEDEDEGKAGLKQVGVIVGIAVAVVAVAAIVIVSLVNGALNSANDLVQNPTLAPNSTTGVWAPAETPTPTPYATATFAALVDPEQSWMDYTYAGDVNQDFDNKLSQSSTATPKPTIRPEATKYSSTISGSSPKEQITSLQQRLAALGWLASGNVNGSYDAATKQAVKDFQNYVNTAIRPSEKLSVDGIAGPKTLQWLYGTDSVKPTPTPTQAVTPDPDQGMTVDKNSSKNDIKAVQRKLIVLGLMNPGTDDGVYGTTTTAAVKKFQQRVNQLQGYNALEVSGVVDPNTMAYLNYYVEWWENLQQATATPAPATPTPEPVLPSTPTPAPTAEPTDAPTPEPTEIPDQGEDNFVVDKDSPKESIQYVQQMLVAVGLLSEGGDDGVYGQGTVNAMLTFQKYVNANLGAGTLPETGVGDAKTLSYLEEFVDRGMVVNPTQAPTQTPTDAPTQAPTDAPTPEPTDAPDQGEDNFVVDKDSPKESIQYVQQMLISAGLLPGGSDDGVYGQGTANAVLTFQKYVNANLGAGTVPETGVADAKTLSYLEEFTDRGMTVNPTDAPTAEPTQAPVQAVELALNLGGGEMADGVYAVTGDRVTFEWAVSGAVSDYYVYVTDGNGDIFYQDEATDRTSGAFQAASLTPGMVYTIRVGALPVGGGESDMVWQEARFGVPAASATDAPTAAPTAEPTRAPGRIESLSLSVNGSAPGGVIEITGETVSFDWSATGDVESYSVYITDGSGNRRTMLENSTSTSGTLKASQLNPGEVYTLQVAAYPTGGGEAVWSEAQFTVPSPAPTETPETVTQPEIVLEGATYDETGMPYVNGTTAVFSWMNRGNVQGYLLYLLNSNGDRLELDKTTANTVTVDVSAFPTGTYRLYVGAVPTTAVSEEDVVWGSLIFTCTAQE